jgi:hypothetical protein
MRRDQRSRRSRSVRHRSTRLTDANGTHDMQDIETCEWCSWHGVLTPAVATVGTDFTPVCEFHWRRERPWGAPITS